MISIFSQVQYIGFFNITIIIHSKNFVFYFIQDIRSKSAAGIASAVSFSDDEDTTQISITKSAARGRKGSSAASRSSRDALELDKSKTSTRGRGRGRGRGSSNLKQTTLDATLGFRQSQRLILVLITDTLILYIRSNLLFKIL